MIPCIVYNNFSLYVSDNNFELFFRGRIPFGDPNDPNSKLMIGLFVGVVLVGLMGRYQSSFKEITWKEFVSNYLARGIVSTQINLKTDCLVESYMLSR